MTTTLVLGAPRSGTSRYAESLLNGQEQVTFVATGPRPAPEDGTALGRRIAQHRAARPDRWRTVESTDLVRALFASRHPVLIDDVTSWVRDLIERSQGWEDPVATTALLREKVDELTLTWRHLPFDVVAVTQEAGWATTAGTPREQALGDALGYVNARLSASSDRVHLVAAGRVLDLSGSPLVPPAAF